MKSDNIQMLFDYNDWANARVLDKAARLSPDLYLASSEIPHDSLHGVLIHTMAAEQIWRMRCEGDSPTRLPSPDDLPTFAALQSAWRQEVETRRDYVAGLSDEDMATKITYANTKGEPFEAILWHILSHVINHGTQHRSEAAQMLTQYGHSPGVLDLIVYLRHVR